MRPCGKAGGQGPRVLQSASPDRLRDRAPHFCRIEIFDLPPPGGLVFPALLEEHALNEHPVVLIGRNDHSVEVPLILDFP